jgi:hypothetical protein
MLYGYFAHNDPDCSPRHMPVSRTPCVSYWDQPTLDRHELNQLLRGADKHDVAFSVASFSGTPVATIRAAIADHEVVLAPIALADEPAEIAAS